MRGSAKRGRIGPAAWLLLPVSVGLIAWFLLRPVPRAAAGPVWAAAAASAAVAFGVLFPEPRRRHVVTAVIGCLLMGLTALASRAVNLFVLDQPLPRAGA